MIKFNSALFKGSLILLITFNAYNFLNFVFQFLMARMLSPADYGTLAALFSIIYLTGIFSESVQTIVTKYAASERDNSKLKNLAVRSIRKSLKISAVIFVMYAILSVPLSFVLDIPYLLVVSTGLIIFTSFLAPITRGLMLGINKFGSLGANLVFESLVKIGLSILLVYIGWRVYGALIATILSMVLSFILSIFLIWKIFKSKEKHMKINEIYAYSKPVFFILFVILAFYSLDVIIAKIVFPADIAGYYAIASLLGKIVLFGTQPISKAMFPLSAAGQKGKNGHILFNAVGIILSCIIVALLVIYFAPGLIIKIFSGRAIIEAENILFYLSIAFSLISLANLVLLYKLSREKISSYWLFVIFPIIEVVLLVIFSHNVVEFSLAFLTASAIFLWGSIFLLDK